MDLYEQLVQWLIESNNDQPDYDRASAEAAIASYELDGKLADLLREAS